MHLPADLLIIMSLSTQAFIYMVSSQEEYISARKVMMKLQHFVRYIYIQEISGHQLVQCSPDHLCPIPD